MTPEVELLLCCLRTQVGQHVAARMGELAAGSIDWPELVRLAALHSVSPLVYRNLSATCWAAVPESTRQALHHSFSVQVGKSLLSSRELLRLLDLFDEAHIPAVPFKGPVLAADAYGDVVLREFGDLDVLVHKHDAARARAILSKQGYRPSAPAGMLPQGGCVDELRRDSTGARFELHWQFDARRFAFPMDAGDVWPHVQPADFLGRRILAFSPEDTFLYLALHGGKHCWYALKWLCDLAEFLRTHPSLDWQRIEQRAHKMGAVRPCLLGIHLAAVLLKAEPPLHLVEAAAADPVVQSLARQVEARLTIGREPAALDGMLMRLRLKERRRDRVRFFLLQMTEYSGAEEGFVRLPRALRFLYPPVRIVWLLRSYGRGLLSAWRHR